MTTYNNVISRSDAAALIPEDVSADIIGHLAQQSAALQLFRHVPMSRAQQRMPVLAALPVAYFINPSDTGLKQTTEADWSNKYLNAEELAAIVPIPEAVLDDTAFDVWGQVRPLLEEAIGRCLDAAVFFGTGIPASWPPAIVPAATTAGNVAVAGTNDQAHGGVVGDISDAFATVESDGYDVNGIVANRLLRAGLRNARATTGEQLAQAPAVGSGGSVDEVYGVPIAYPLRGLWPTGAGAAEAVVGDFTEGILGVRQDLTYKILDQAVIQDGTGAIQFNLAQQDMVAMRVVARFGFQVKATLTYDQPVAAQRYPFGVLHAAEPHGVPHAGSKEEASMSSSSKSSPPSKASASTTDTATPDSIPLPDYEAALEQGFIGVSPDARPNEDYTVDGVTARAAEGPPDITAEVQPAASA